MDSEEHCVMIQVTWLDHCTKSGKTVDYILNEQVMFISTTQGTSTILCVLDVDITCSKRGQNQFSDRNGDHFEGKYLFIVTPYRMFSKVFG